MPEDLDLALLDRAQRADEGQQGGLSGSRRSRHHDQLPRRDFDPVVEQHLAARLPVTIEMVEPLDQNDRLPSLHNPGIERRNRISDHGRAHQNTSAGSAAMTRRTARIADIKHMPRVNPRLIKVSSTVIRKGSSASSPTIL